ncbi:MAG: hypothetical protein IPO17_15045 [Flavobacteriales bacterium]|nr:hypothetical protein [Flavobacteriales bacterium]
MSYKFTDNNSISFLFMPNVQGQNDARSFRGSEFNFAATEIVIGADQTYEEKQQLIYQVQSTNYLPKSKVRIDLNASYTDGQMNVLDFREVIYYSDTVSGLTQFSSNSSLPRRFRFMDEDLFDARLGIEFPLMDGRAPAQADVRRCVPLEPTRELAGTVHRARGCRDGPHHLA